MSDTDKKKPLAPFILTAAVLIIDQVTKIAVVATDCPLSVHQLNRLCKRAALGIGRAGSYAAHGSGEIILGFSTANALPRREDVDFYNINVIADRFLDPFYQACVESTEEAIINALCMAEPMTGLAGRYVPALPLRELAELFGNRRPRTPPV